LDLLPTVLEKQLSGRRIIFAGTDPGLVTTSTTVSKTLEDVLADINRFEVLSTEDSNDDKTDMDVDMDVKMSKMSKMSVKPLPKPSRITAGLINNVTFDRKHRKNREKRQACGVSASSKLAKEQYEREIRTKKAYSKICGNEKKQICSSVEGPTDVIYCVGHWQGVNCTIKGHSRRGMKKIRKQYCALGSVGITNEYNTSKLCSHCFSRVVLHRVRRTINGVERVVRLNGAVNCVNPRCLARNTTRGRDANAAANIALSGASVLLSADGQPLPPFRRHTNDTRYILDEHFGVDTKIVHPNPTWTGDHSKNYFII
jgi:hypothetical protein